MVPFRAMPKPALSMDTTHEPHPFRYQASRANRKRRRTAALPDAIATATRLRPSARFWSAPPQRRFRFSRGSWPNARHRRRGGLPMLPETGFVLEEIWPARQRRPTLLEGYYVPSVVRRRTRAGFLLARHGLRFINAP